MKKLFNTPHSLAALVYFVLVMATMSVNAETYPEAGDFAKGAQAWADNCNRCHNMRDPKDLRDDQWITTAFHMRMRAGLTGQQTRDILTFLQQSNNESLAVASSTASSSDNQPQAKKSGLSGEQVYQQTCIACHGGDGSGTVPGAPNFSAAKSPLTKSDAVLLKNINEGFQTPGSPMAMPAKGGNSSLTADDIKQVLAYIRLRFGKK